MGETDVMQYSTDLTSCLKIKKLTTLDNIMFALYQAQHQANTQRSDQPIEDKYDCCLILFVPLLVRLPVSYWLYLSRMSSHINISFLSSGFI